MPPKEDWITPKAEIRETETYGKGLFAVNPITAGEKVVVWRGNYVTAADAEIAKRGGKLVMQFDDNLFTIEDRGESLAYFINHSCDSNLWMADTFTLVARRDINRDEELTIDYVLFEGDESYVSKWECICGSAHCRRKVTGVDWKLKDLQDRYKGHFIPMINRRIQALSNSSN